MFDTLELFYAEAIKDSWKISLENTFNTCFQHGDGDDDDDDNDADDDDGDGDDGADDDIFPTHFSSTCLQSIFPNFLSSLSSTLCVVNTSSTHTGVSR